MHIDLMRYFDDENDGFLLKIKKKVVSIIMKIILNFLNKYDILVTFGEGKNFI